MKDSAVKFGSAVRNHVNNNNFYFRLEVHKKKKITKESYMTRNTNNNNT